MKTPQGIILCLIGAAAVLTGCVTPPPPAPPPPPPSCRLSAQPKSDAVAALARTVAAAVRGDLVRRGHRFTDGRRAPDGGEQTLVSLLFDRQEAARLDGWVAYDADVAAKVTAPDGVLLGEKTFRAKGARGRTPAEADAHAADALVPQLNAWLPRVLPPPPRPSK